MSYQNDKGIIRDLAAKVAEIAALPVQKKRLQEWKDINSLKPQRPMFMISQICWHELSVDGELALQCEDQFSRDMEITLRKKLYKWNHLRDDEVVEPFFEVAKVIHGGMYNLQISETLLRPEGRQGTASHRYEDQLKTDEDIERLDIVAVTYDAKATKENAAKANDLLGEALDVRVVGKHFGLAVWDRISQFRGVEKILYDIIDRPDFIHKTMTKFTQLSAKLLDQLETLGLIEPAQPLIHCSGAWTNELPKDGFDADMPRACDAWTSGMAQLFSTVSPEMHDEFDIQYLKPLYEKFGLVNYGCCEPLDRKIGIIKQINNIRKISVSPWADQQRAAEQMKDEYIFLRKPNPAMVAVDIDDKVVRDHLQETLDICRKNNAIPEFILKDISTVKNKPQNLWRWCDIAREVVGG